MTDSSTSAIDDKNNEVNSDGQDSCTPASDNWGGFAVSLLKTTILFLIIVLFATGYIFWTRVPFELIKKVFPIGAELHNIYCSEKCEAGKKAWNDELNAVGEVEYNMGGGGDPNNPAAQGEMKPYKDGSGKLQLDEQKTKENCKRQFDMYAMWQGPSLYRDSSGNWNLEAEYAEPQWPYNQNTGKPDDFGTWFASMVEKTFVFHRWIIRRLLGWQILDERGRDDMGGVEMVGIGGTGGMEMEGMGGYGEDPYGDGMGMGMDSYNMGGGGFTERVKGMQRTAGESFNKGRSSAISGYNKAKSSAASGYGKAKASASAGYGRARRAASSGYGMASDATSRLKDKMKGNMGGWETPKDAHLFNTFVNGQIPMPFLFIMSIGMFIYLITIFITTGFGTYITGFMASWNAGIWFFPYIILVIFMGQFVGMANSAYQMFLSFYYFVLYPAMAKKGRQGIPINFPYTPANICKCNMKFLALFYGLFVIGAGSCNLTSTTHTALAFGYYGLSIIALLMNIYKKRINKDTLNDINSTAAGIFPPMGMIPGMGPGMMGPGMMGPGMMGPGMDPGMGPGMMGGNNKE